MRSSQDFNIMLPTKMAEIIGQKIQSGAYATVSEVMRDGVRALMERESAVERWLREEVIAGHVAYCINLSKGIAPEEILPRIKARRASAGHCKNGCVVRTM